MPMAPYNAFIWRAKVSASRSNTIFRSQQSKKGEPKFTFFIAQATLKTSNSLLMLDILLFTLDIFMYSILRGRE